MHLHGGWGMGEGVVVAGVLVPVVVAVKVVAVAVVVVGVAVIIVSWLMSGLERFSQGACTCLAVA